MSIKGLAWGIVLSGLMWAGILWLMVGCVPVTAMSEDGPIVQRHRVDHAGEVGFFPRTDPGVIVGGPRNGSIVHNGRIYNEDGSMEYLRR